jgi:hypothetical protein
VARLRREVARYVEPLWVTVPSGVILALIAPSLAAGEHGWVYVIGIATAAAAMAASVPLRNTPLLALGTLAMFGYVTGWWSAASISRWESRGRWQSPACRSSPWPPSLPDCCVPHTRPSPGSQAQRCRHT